MSDEGEAVWLQYFRYNLHAEGIELGLQSNIGCRVRENRGDKSSTT